MAASARSPYFIPSRKRRRPAAPIRAMPQAGWRRRRRPERWQRGAPGPGAQDDARKPAEGDLGESGQDTQDVAGKKGNRKASTRKISVLAWITSRYFSETFRPTRRVTASRPRPRARRTPAATRWRPRKRLAGRRPRCRRALRLNQGGDVAGDGEPG